MDNNERIQVLKEKFSNAQKLLVGIGSEWKPKTEDDILKITEAAGKLKSMLDGRDYHVVTTLSGEDLERLPFEKEHMTAPLDVSFTDDVWNAYIYWVSLTLNRETALLELGCGFGHPSTIRWPFERIAMVNNKAKLFRVHETLSQIPGELTEKAVSIAENSVDMILSMNEDERKNTYGGNYGSDR